MKYLVSIVREIEVDAFDAQEAKFKAIELDGRPGEVHHVQAELMKAHPSEATMSMEKV